MIKEKKARIILTTKLDAEHAQAFPDGLDPDFMLETADKICDSLGIKDPNVGVGNDEVTIDFSLDGLGNFFNFHALTMAWTLSRQLGLSNTTDLPPAVRRQSDFLAQNLGIADVRVLDNKNIYGEDGENNRRSYVRNKDGFAEQVLTVQAKMLPPKQG